MHSRFMPFLEEGGERYYGAVGRIVVLNSRGFCSYGFLFFFLFGYLYNLTEFFVFFYFDIIFLTPKPQAPPHKILTNLV